MPAQVIASLKLTFGARRRIYTQNLQTGLAIVLRQNKLLKRTFVEEAAFDQQWFIIEDSPNALSAGRYMLFHVERKVHGTCCFINIDTADSYRDWKLGRIHTPVKAIFWPLNHLIASSLCVRKH